MALWVYEGTHDSPKVVPICGDAVRNPYCVCIDRTVHSLLLPNLLAVRGTEERLPQPVVRAPLSLPPSRRPQGLASDRRSAREDAATFQQS